MLKHASGLKAQSTKDRDVDFTSLCKYSAFVTEKLGTILSVFTDVIDRKINCVATCVKSLVFPREEKEQHKEK